MIYRGFGSLLNKLRTESGISVSILSRGTGISRSSIYRWEKEDTNPASLSIIKTIADFFGVPPSYFFHQDYPDISELASEIQELRNDFEAFKKSRKTMTSGKKKGRA